MPSAVMESETLLNAQLGFLDTRVALIHIPLPIYPLLLQPLLHLLLHRPPTSPPPPRPWMFWSPFVNISLTPTECSIVCPRRDADALFLPVIAALPPVMRKSVTVSKEDYSVIQIGGEGLEAGKRVVDLTSPLALAGIPIFFITSYYSDYILVPHPSRSPVISALETRGFIFTADAGTDAGHMLNPASPLLHPRPRQNSSSSLSLPSPTTPPPSTLPALQTRTFHLLTTHHIRPTPNPEVELITCAAITPSTATNYSPATLTLSLAALLTLSPPPSFLSLTLTSTDSASLTLPKNLLQHFPDEGEDILLGIEGPVQVAVTLDLRELPEESTGIVCGVAGKLVEGVRLEGGMSYLSTARAGHVVVWKEELDLVMAVLEGEGKEWGKVGDG